LDYIIIYPGIGALHLVSEDTYYSKKHPANNIPF